MGLLSFLLKLGKGSKSCPSPAEAAAAATEDFTDDEKAELGRFSRRMTKLTQKLAASAKAETEAAAKGKSHTYQAEEKSKILSERTATRINSTRNMESLAIINHLYALNAELIKQGLKPLTEDEALEAAAPCDMCDRKHCDDTTLRDNLKEKLRPYLPEEAAAEAAESAAAGKETVESYEILKGDLKNLIEAYIVKQDEMREVDNEFVKFESKTIAMMIDSVLDDIEAFLEVCSKKNEAVLYRSLF